jgi:hypothetical protein
MPPGDAAHIDQEIEGVAAGHGGLIFKQVLCRMDPTAAASLRLLRWMIWHALHGRWAPRRPSTVPGSCSANSTASR